MTVANWNKGERIFSYLSLCLVIYAWLISFTELVLRGHEVLYSNAKLSIDDAHD